MPYLVTADEMKRCDNYIIEKMGVPSMVLMERASLVSQEELLNEIKGKSDPDMNVLCVCGAGNNGGDGFAVARLLYLKGISVEILFLGDRSKTSHETSQQYKIAENYKIPIHDNDLDILQGNNYSWIIDAIFGIGLKRNIEGKYKDIIIQINSASSLRETKVLALDIPSGLSTDTGQIMGVAVKAYKTVTFAYKKLGMTLEKGPQYCGKTVVRDIGITDIGFGQNLPKHKY